MEQLADLLVAQDPLLNKKVLLRDNKLDELRKMYYKPGDKKALTKAEGRDILGMYYEAQKQKKLDLD